MQKLYIVVRADLPPGLLVAQACHAVSAFAVAHPMLHARWHTDGKNIAVLSVPNRAALEALYTRAGERDVDRAAFYETDLAGELTSLALVDRAKPLVASLPLALREAQRAA